MVSRHGDDCDLFQQRWRSDKCDTNRNTIRCMYDWIAILLEHGAHVALQHLWNVACARLKEAQTNHYMFSHVHFDSADKLVNATNSARRWLQGKQRDPRAAARRVLPLRTVQQAMRTYPTIERWKSSAQMPEAGSLLVTFSVDCPNPAPPQSGCDHDVSSPRLCGQLYRKKGAQLENGQNGWCWIVSLDVPVNDMCDSCARKEHVVVGEDERCKKVEPHSHAAKDANRCLLAFYQKLRGNADALRRCADDVDEMVTATAATAQLMGRLEEVPLQEKQNRRVLPTPGKRRLLESACGSANGM